jgi:hypothetical protein
MASTDIQGFKRDTVTGALLVSGASAPLGDGENGAFAPSARGWHTSLVALTASRAYFVKFVPDRDMTIASIKFHVGTLGADVACDVGIYSADLQTRHAVSTAAASRLNTTGIKNIALTASYTMRAGTTYYIAFSSDAGSTAILTFSTLAGALTASFPGTAAGDVIMDYKAASHPLPTTLSVTGGLGGAALLYVQEA